MPRPCYALVLIALYFASGLAAAKTLTGTAGEVFDGDTFVLEQDNADAGPRIRLWGIDAPESSQAYGEEAGEALQRAIGDEPLRVDVIDRDQYGRIVGKVWVKGRSVNYWMVQAGHAWRYSQYNDDPRYLAAQKTAQNRRWGLWALPSDQRMRPSDYRHRR